MIGGRFEYGLRARRWGRFGPRDGRVDPMTRRIEHDGVMVVAWRVLLGLAAAGVVGIVVAAGWALTWLVSRAGGG
ncbi:hypothetical protein Q3W71_29580 [Micromonospora sp. C28SCA-DRY-2]|uniref:hypothetical protein n=1 Tax=Micromonospora sp. C28SCA-DRY-2 TaxID=3059522 RepID=UPI00267443B6|nr:hypothetical protein [Micromonospora sp. C28SCA-DRY-2]MDO3705829.1 hypothetical protein [Micromonospora sp. C28SCA-DRY-2]